jgi:DNA-binding transcriptional LysR family regulator
VRGRLTLARFAALPHVLVAPYGNAGSFVDEALAKKGMRRTVAIRVSSFLSAPVIVAESDCIGTVSSRLARWSAGWLPLRLLEPPLPLPEISIGAVWHPRVEEDAGHRWFRDVLLSIAKPSPAPAPTAWR